MACYIVSYDLRNPGRNYEDLYEHLKSYRKWAKLTESTWAIVTENSAVEVRDHLKYVLDENDRIFVIKSAGVAAWSNSICRNEWLKDNL